MQTMGKVTATTATNGQPVDRPLVAYESMVRCLSDRLVEAQRPIRILDAIKWDDDIERAFFARAAASCRPSPATITCRGRCPSIPSESCTSCHAIERDIRRQLGEFNARRPDHVAHVPGVPRGGPTC